MPTVFDHTTYDAVEFDEDAKPLLSRFWRRVLPAARRKDYVVVDVDDRPDAEVALLNRLGLGPDLSRLVAVDSHGNIVSGETDFPGCGLDVFTQCSDASYRFARGHGLSWGARNPATARWHNHKGFLQVCRDALLSDCFRVPEGCQVSSKQETLQAIQRFHARGISARFKPGDSASGMGQRVFHTHTSLRGAEIPSIGVVQEDLGDGLLSLSVQYQIYSENRFQYDLLTGQILDGHDFVGGTFPCDLVLDDPVDPKLKGLILERALPTLRLLAKRGVRGRGSMDVLVDPETSATWLVDLNSRTSAIWYAMAIQRRLKLSEPSPFIMKSFTLPFGFGPERIEEYFGDLFQSGGVRVIPFCMIPDVRIPGGDSAHDAEFGFMYTLTTGTSEALVQVRFDQLRERHARIGSAAA